MKALIAVPKKEVDVKAAEPQRKRTKRSASKKSA